MAFQAENRKYKGLPKRAKRAHSHPEGDGDTVFPEGSLRGQWTELGLRGRDRKAKRRAQARA